jgi:hypothetical protein
MLIVGVLLFTVVLRLVIVATVVYLLLPAGPLCPHCKVEMVPIRNRLFDTLIPLLQRRWCMECGWNGVVRRIRGVSRRPRTARRTPRTTPE